MPRSSTTATMAQPTKAVKRFVIPGQSPQRQCNCLTAGSGGGREAHSRAFSSMGKSRLSAEEGASSPRELNKRLVQQRHARVGEAILR
jgi:hypothetical protein